MNTSPAPRPDTGGVFAEKRDFPSLVWGFLLLLLLPACTPAVTGVSGTSLVHNAYPAVTVSANEPLELMAYGREYVTLKSDILTNNPPGFFDFAVYSDSREGPVSKSAHSIILRPNNEILWRFSMEGYKEPHTFSLANSGYDGMAFVERVMVVQAAGDWFSDMWTASGRSVPERWLAKRFSSSPADSIRLVAEYREPWPEGLDETALQLGLLSASAYDALLRPFLRRADKAFSFRRGADELLPPPARPMVLTRPDSAPNPTKLAGEVEQNDQGLRDRPRRF